MSEKHFIGKRLFSFSDNGLRDPVSRVTLLVDDENAVTAGDDTGLELLANCPYADETLAKTLLNQVKGYQYRAFEAQSADLDPAAELGDGITADGVYSVLAGITDKGDGYPDIFAPGAREEEDEYPDGGPLTRLFNRQLAQTRSLISKNSGSIELLVEKTGELGEQYSSIGLRLDSISLTVYGKAATETEEAVLGLTGRMTSAEASIKLNADNLSLTVKKGSIISAINQSAETIKISAGKINLDGYVTFSALKDGPDEDNGQTFINGGWIDTENMTVKNAVNAQKLSGEEIALMNGTKQFGAITMKSSETYALDISSKTSLRLQSGYGFNTFIGYNEGPHLLLTGSPLIPGAMKCKLQGGALVIGTKSYGTDDPPVTGNEEAGQVYFKLLS